MPIADSPQRKSGHKKSRRRGSIGVLGEDNKRRLAAGSRGGAGTYVSLPGVADVPRLEYTPEQAVHRGDGVVLIGITQPLDVAVHVENIAAAGHVAEIKRVAPGIV